MEREVAVQQRRALTGRVGFCQYLLSLLDQTSCHFLLTSRRRPPPLTLYPSRYRRLAPLHPLDAAAVFVHRLSHTLSAADLAPYVCNNLQELLRHPLIAMMQGNARAVERLAEAERLIGLRDTWQLMRDVDDVRRREDHLGDDALTLIRDAQRLARLTRDGDAELKRTEALLHAHSGALSPTSPMTSSPRPPQSPSLSPLTRSPADASVGTAVPPSAHPSMCCRCWTASGRVG